VKNRGRAGAVESSPQAARRRSIEVTENLKFQKRDSALARLECNLKSLECYCRPPVDGQAELDVEAEDANSELAQWLEKRRVLWPCAELLRQIDDDVIELAVVGRRKPIVPKWKAYLQVDRRNSKLRLKSRLDALVRRALERVSGESELEIAAREPGSASAQCLVSDILCGARSLERLLDDYRQRIVQKAKFGPLFEWLVVNGHPFSKEFGPVAEHYVLDAAAWNKRKLLLQSKASRTRMRRHRKKFSKNA
jgi:hypothetical protein